ncbi:MAG: DUF1295 domain-containing protein [Candidatus Thioglobus sp.]|nr:MAG: DUF1295 domain-containing protein [Candidatus Thioglobus sp.]
MYILAAAAKIYVVLPSIHSGNEKIHHINMISLNLLVESAAWCLALSVVAWSISVVRTDVGIADVFWPWFSAGSAVIYALDSWPLPATSVGFLGLLIVSASRLSLAVIRRTHRAGEDRRYTDIRNRWGKGFAIKSLPGIFLMQGLMGFALAMPLAYAVTGFQNASILGSLFIAVWFLGFLLQVTADRQLSAFSKADDGTGVLSTGVWRYSRHPNYFGELCMVWAIFGLAAANGGAWTLFAPLLMTWSILRFTGISRMEDGISSRRPGYESYMKKTSALIPLPPRKHV